MKNKKIIITGSSGFIGYHVSKKLLEKKYSVIGIDNHNNYYNPKIKLLRLKELKKNKNFKFCRFDIKNKNKFNQILNKTKPYIIIHLAAQAGVRYSFKEPQKYIDSNITGFTNILEGMKKFSLKKLIYASSSSVYGDCKKFPFNENLELNPLNFYGQTKLINEKIANIYEKNYGIKAIGLRFFTVYGPHGRPDMLIPKIINKIKNNKTLELYNNGNHFRDFTYVEDVSNIIYTITKKINYNFHQRLFNICSGKEINIKKIIKIIEINLNKKIKITNKPFQRGDMKKTHGNNLLLKKVYKITKFVKFEDGIKKTLKIDF
tara:strand:- start:776 stop:1729 length:954 start_codon:yes stop_codon:yes gene_type:complete